MTGDGVRVEMVPGVQSRSRGDAPSVDALTSSIERTRGVRIIDSATITRLELTSPGTRGAAGDGALAIELGERDGDEGLVALIEEGGRYTWAIPASGAERVVVPIEALPGSRGFIPKAVRRVVHRIGVNTVGWALHRATNTVVGAWDERRHPYGLRSWTPENHRDAAAPAPDWATLTRGPALLVIHGFTGSIDGSFGDLPPEIVGRIHDAYGGRTFAFDHPTLADSPRKNAEWLRDHLGGAGPMTLDILAHSRGGLVARDLAQRLSGDGLVVRSITFVATPNDGTPLADPKRPLGLLDGLTNLIGSVPGGEIVEMVLELLKDVVLGSSLAGLEGLVAMTPGCEYLTELNGLDVAPELALRSISADFEPRSDAGIVQTARNRAVDLYFGHLRNDLIVPTVSTIVTGGSFSVPAGQRLVLDSSRGVDHSSFWTNPRATRQLTEWLRADWPDNKPAEVSAEETEPAAETALPPDPVRIEDVVKAVRHLPPKARKAVESLLGGPLDDNAAKPDGQRPAVVVIPGIMGTHLRHKDGDLVWIDPYRLRRGHFGDLSLAGSTDIEPAGLNNTYLPLITRLAATRDVYLAPFDWRVDICESAARVATLLREQVLATSAERPVHIVAHSMGGLVARALAFVAPDVWAEMASPNRGDSGRLVMLGTPNKGSFAIALMLAGDEMIVKALGALDVRSTAEDLLAVVATFPGVYQMLPWESADPVDDDHGKLFDVSRWASGGPVSKNLLVAAQAFHEQMAEVHDPDRLVCVAGYGHPTPYRLELSNGSFTVGRFRRGDGRVAIPLAVLDGVTTYYVKSTHGGLPSDSQVLASLDDLLTTGRTTTLEDSEPVRRGDDALERPPMIPIELFDANSGGGRDVVTVNERDPESLLDDALRLTIGGGAKPGEHVRLEVGVLHASLEQATYPVAVGHYAGLPPDGAERFLDYKLDGALRARQRIGLYPDSEASAIYVPVPEGRRPRGGMVLGLGAYGALTTATLAEAMAKAVLARVLDERQRTVPGDGPPSFLGISAVLIGTPGRHGLSIESSIVAMAEGVLEAVARLRTIEPPVHLEAVELELVELYEQRAEQAAVIVTHLSDLLEPSLVSRVDVMPAERLRWGEGGRPSGPATDASGTPWVRVLVGIDPPKPAVPNPNAADSSPSGAAPKVSTVRTMRFSTLARGAQSNLIEYDIDLAKVQAYIGAAVLRTDDDTTVTRTLYELLFPLRAKLDLDRSESLHLLVDDEMAEIPWELLAATSASGDVTPLALRAGMLRQLHSARQTRERSEAPTGRMALLVGDPPTGYARLPWARHEAEQLATLLTSRGWEVNALIGSDDEGDGDEWSRVLDALYARPYRMVHIAAHGVVDDEDPRRTGVVIGPEPHHRLTALEFEAMTVTPELVFLNCCHLAAMNPSAAMSAEERRSLEQPHRLAATIARQLLRNGVRAVVVAGWAVDDSAAMTFAEQLYESMLDGHPFGEAVRRARVAAHEADNGLTNTWGAYQCYGDPDFTLGADSKVASERPPIVSTAQLTREFELLALNAGNSMLLEDCDEVGRQIDLLRAAGAELIDDGSVLEAMGHAFGELGRYEEAVAAYTQSLHQEKGRIRLHAVEQLVNLKVRSAVRLARLARLAEGPPPARVGELFDEAAAMLGQLQELAGHTAERHAVRGSLEKKRAATLEGDARLPPLDLARESYRTAWDISSDHGTKRLDSYHTNLWLQLIALTSGTMTIGESDARWLDALYEQLVEPHPTNRTGYWEIAAIGDVFVTAVVVGRPIDGTVVELEDARQKYDAAFRLRSTVRQRESALDHLYDLSKLVPDDRAEMYRDLFDRMSAPQTTDSA